MRKSDILSQLRIFKVADFLTCSKVCHRFKRVEKLNFIYRFPLFYSKSCSPRSQIGDII